MGIYLVSIDEASEWFGEEEGEWGEIAAALNEELTRRALPPYVCAPEAMGTDRDPGPAFEEKLIPSMDGFTALCEAHLSPEEAEVLCGWAVLVPISLHEEVWLPVDIDYTDGSTMVAGAPQVLTIAETLAAAIGLPAEVPSMCRNLELTTWFLDGPAKDLAAVRPGLWCEDLDAAFYVALYLRAAQHSLRHGCPIIYS
ncbi:hypothetical protein [Kitasatospora sp. NPDC050543]|uniref:hypothetical protein n=1 Tax=Kitasatospora sp. NPDC050543 TaxID=3364054 RepID=UPI0037B44A74